MIALTVTEHEEDVRLDVWLAAQSGVARAQWQQWIRSGRVRIDGEPVRKSALRVREGMHIVSDVPHSPAPTLEPECIALDIVYEDDDVLVVNKPRGMVVHPAAGHWAGTLVHGLLHHCAQLAQHQSVRPGIVHRIDKDTSGLLIVTKHEQARAHIAQQLMHHTVHRQYVALVCGVLAHDTLTIDAPIGRDVQHRKRFVVVDGGRVARTHVRVVERMRQHTLVRVTLDTGRTHQIRVHMRYIGHPIACDAVYGGQCIERSPFRGQALHAEVLSFIHPRTEETIHCTAPIPDAMQQLIACARAEMGKG